ncbi:MAG: tyrosine-protein phosphatase [Pseudoclavibacter sp.]
MQSSPDLHLPGTFNARLSGIDAAGAPWLVRSATLDGVQPEAIDELSRLGVTTVVDLRDTPERPAAAPPGLNVISAPLYRLLGGAPASGDIDGIYRLLVERRARELAAAVAAVARAEGAVLVHCTLGKDRTGLVVALARLAAGDDRAAAVADYEISGSRVPAAERERVQHEVAALHLPAGLAAQTLLMRLESPAWALEHALDGIERAYGSAVAYLLAHGLTATEAESLQSKAARRGEMASPGATAPRDGAVPTPAPEAHR